MLLVLGLGSGAAGQHSTRPLQALKYKILCFNAFCCNGSTVAAILQQPPFWYYSPSFLFPPQTQLPPAAKAVASDGLQLHSLTYTENVRPT